MSSEVTNLQAESTDDTTLIISWEPPATPNGNILSYSVSVTNFKDGSVVRKENTTSSTITQIGLGIIHFFVNNSSSYPLYYRTWSSLQCEYCSSEWGRSRRVQYVYLLL